MASTRSAPAVIPWPNYSYLYGILALYILTLPLFGCGISESAATIKGTVKDERDRLYQECRLELRDTSDQHVLDYRPTSGDFFVTFVIAPERKLYPLHIACMGSDETHTIGPILLGDMTTSLTPFDLGTIRLKRRVKSR
jgi:hypothetical protein